MPEPTGDSRGSGEVSWSMDERQLSEYDTETVSGASWIADEFVRIGSRVGPLIKQCHGIALCKDKMLSRVAVVGAGGLGYRSTTV